MDYSKKRMSDPSEIGAKKISQGRQDLQDYSDREAFGLRHLAAGEKNPNNPVNPV
jgi:hypothetical protein